MSTTPEEQSRAKPTLEDLIRLKRAERPDAAFWHDFERGMRKKQLAAIIEPKPWWLGLSILSSKFGPLGIPVSAGAAAMLALVVMRVSPVGSFVQFGLNSVPEQLVTKLSSRDQVTSAITPETKVAAPLSTHIQILTKPENSYAVSAVESPLVTNPAKSGQANNGVGGQSMPGYSVANKANGRPSPVAASKVALVAMAHYTPPKPSPVVDPSAPEQAVAELNGSAFASAGEDQQAEKSELSQRQARLLSSATDLEEGKSLANVRERVLHRLADDEARYASISRVGVNADRLSLKF